MPGFGPWFDQTEDEMELHSIALGPFQANAWLLVDGGTRHAMLIDPGDEPETLLSWIGEKGVELKYLIATHGHLDHVAASREVAAEFGLKLHIHKNDLPILSRLRDSRLGLGLPPVDPPESTEILEEGKEIRLGNLSFRVVHTPGHTPGSVCIHGHGLIFTGDLIFMGSVGRTDLPGGNTEELKLSLKRKITVLPDETRILPGHGPETTVGNEKRMNFFLKEL